MQWHGHKASSCTRSTGSHSHSHSCLLDFPMNLMRRLTNCYPFPIRTCLRTSPDTYMKNDVLSIQHGIVNHVEYTMARSRYKFDDFEAYQATSLSLRDRLIGEGRMGKTLDLADSSGRNRGWHPGGNFGCGGKGL